jgi:excinuclease UvrABC nuclease subunit
MVASLRISGFDLLFKDMSYIDMKLLKNRAGIYMITNKINGKFYIGKSKDIANRFYAYLNINRL